jgi:hypothetical protein
MEVLYQLSYPGAGINFSGEGAKPNAPSVTNGAFGAAWAAAATPLVAYFLFRAFPHFGFISGRRLATLPF